MLGQVNPTPYDLYFSLFGIPIRVTPWFWLVGGLMGHGYIEMRRFDLLLVWIGCLFFSILIHELGHALAGRMFGWPSDVILYHFGGVARFYHRDGYTAGRQVVVSFAGPWAGFLVYGGVLLFRFVAARNQILVNEYVAEALWQLEWICLYWGLVNLLPVLPLDGGRISEALFDRYRPRDGVIWCLRIGAFVGAVAAACFFYLRLNYAGFLFALLAIDNFQQLEQTRSGW
jgi:Zn-dependent protease